jgi:hypothetical protein
MNGGRGRGANLPFALSTLSQNIRVLVERHDFWQNEAKIMNIFNGPCATIGPREAAIRPTN